MNFKKWNNGIINILILFTITIGIYFFVQKYNINKINNDYYKSLVQNYKKSVQVNTTLKNSITVFDSKNKFEKIPVLMYHSVGDPRCDYLNIPANQFNEEMKFLRDNKFKTLSLDELYNYYMLNRLIPKKSVVITFDDGYADNYKYAYPILKKYKLKATIFVITNRIDENKNYLTSKEICELQKNGIDIESHLANHEKLWRLSENRKLSTLRKSKLVLEKLLNKKVNFLAYPYGQYDASSLLAAKEAGYKMGFLASGGWTDRDDGILTLKRVFIGKFNDLSCFEQRVEENSYKLHMFTCKIYKIPFVFIK